MLEGRFTMNPNKWGVAGKAWLDVTMGYIGFLGPIGVSATYFIILFFGFIVNGE